MTPVGWGFLGAGFVASRALAPAVHTVSDASLVAVAARDIERGRRLEPDRAYGSYRAVLENPSVEVVYISLTNEAHVSWVLESLAAGKHVLCEKPLGLTATEVELMVEAAERHGRLLVEAVSCRWHPRTRRAEALLRSGAIGEVTSVAASFCFDGVPAGNYRLEPRRGGGALYDVGCYAISAAVWATGGAAAGNVVGQARLGPTGVDLTTEAEFDLGAARITIRASIDDPPDQELAIRGQRGEITLGGPPESDAFTSWHARSRLIVHGEEARIESFAACDPYALMVEAVSQAIRGEDQFLVTSAESHAVARILDSVSEETLRAGTRDTR